MHWLWLVVCQIYFFNHLLLFWQKMLIEVQFVNLNLMLQRWSSSRMQLRIYIGLSSSWVYLLFCFLSLTGSLSSMFYSIGFALVLFLLLMLFKFLNKSLFQFSFVCSAFSYFALFPFMFALFLTFADYMEQTTYLYGVCTCVPFMYLLIFVRTFWSGQLCMCRSNLSTWMIRLCWWTAPW